MRNILTDLTQQFILPLWDQKDISVIDNFVSPTAEIHTTFLTGIGPEALKKKIQKVLSAFTFIDFAVDEIIQHQNKYIYKWQGVAADLNPLSPLNTTDRNKIFSGIISVEVSEGFIVRYYSFCDIVRVLNPTCLLPGEKTVGLPTNIIDEIISTTKKITGRRLTRREVECLSLWLKGFSIKETAKLLGGLSGRTIQTFRENIKRKMNVETYRQLFTLVQQYGIISLLLN